jgi:hypothetical protein
LTWPEDVFLDIFGIMVEPAMASASFSVRFNVVG